VRKALNSNPLAQVGLIAVLGLVVAFMLLRNLSGGEEEAAPPPAATETAPATSDAATAPATDPAAPAPATDPAAPAGTPPVDPALAAAEFKAGPGLPEPVVKAYEGGDTVVVLINRHGAIEDRLMRRVSRQVQAIDNVAYFEIATRDVANYSRIAEGVDLDRVPALVVLSPKSVSGDGLPVATVSYGARGLRSAQQTVHDARYDGKKFGYDPQ
jgi:hypothetical protein